MEMEKRSLAYFLYYNALVTSVSFFLDTVCIDLNKTQVQKIAVMPLNCQGPVRMYKNSILGTSIHWSSISVITMTSY